jgi:hypothetical protein
MSTEANLFGDDPALDPSLSADGRLMAFRRARRATYGAELLALPPVTSCDAHVVGDESAARNAKRYADRDEARMHKAERKAGLTVVSLDRLVALEQALRDHLQLHDDDIATGGNGSKDIDLDELMSRTQALLDATTIVLPTPGGTS